MRKVIYILALILSYPIYGQSLSLFDINLNNFPTIKAKFYAFDKNGKQITNLIPSDFVVKENGFSRTVTYVSCPEPKPPIKVSIAMSLDVSGSMAHSHYGEIPVELGKTTASELCKLVVMPPSEFALQTCDEKAVILADFKTDKNKILTAISLIKAAGDNDFVEQLLNPRTGLLNIVKTGRNKRIAVIYTDAWWPALTQDELKRCKDTCSKNDIRFFAVIYSRPETEPFGIKSTLEALAISTGGVLYDGITSSNAAREIANNIQQSAQGYDPCVIKWQSEIACLPGKTSVDVKLLPINKSVKTSYHLPKSAVASLEFNPKSIKFLNGLPGIKLDTTITITAWFSDFNITNIKSSNAAFIISPKNFKLTDGESKSITISYIPADSGYNYTKITIENNVCPTIFFASGGFPGKKPKIKTLKLIHPNGGEVFVIGSDTVVTWEGVSPGEQVKIEYSTNSGTIWNTITDSATGLIYKWHIPKTPSKECIARITTKEVEIFSGCDLDVQICGQIWSPCNLNVDHYRNGDSLPQVQYSDEWKNLDSGAWCYYNNDPSLGKLYGKLYNWYAVNDPRGLAPVGWHIPTDEEWKEMEMCLGMSQSDADKEYELRGTNEGGKLKTTGTINIGNGLWNTPNTGATNESGFSGLPGGQRYIDGNFIGMSSAGVWWTSSGFFENGYLFPWCRQLTCNNSSVLRFKTGKNEGFSVRLVRD
ncbi:MAG: hypothetical protein HW421_3810 [Ignavibacteria bacterium]|nr:hypothetical protein [Ignavibacteria bacterium]